jgi:hypothetical protein
VSRGDDLRIADIVAAADDLATLVARGRAAFDADPFLQRAACPGSWAAHRAVKRLSAFSPRAARVIPRE